MIYNLINIIFIVIIGTLSSSCSSNPVLNQDKNSSKITNFDMKQHNSKTLSEISIKSPEAILNEAQNQVSLKQSLITISNNKNEGISIKSDKAVIDKQSNIVTAEGKIDIKNISDKNITIKGDRMTWDINSSLLLLKDNIYLKNINSELLSDKASYKIKDNIINFLDLKYYKYLYEKMKSKYTITIIAEKAIFNANNDTLFFDSDSKQVETIIDIYN